MAQVRGNTAVSDGNGGGDWVKLAKGLNMVHVTCATWSTSEAALEMSKDGTDANAGAYKDSGTAVSFSANGQSPVWGDGQSWVRINVSNYNADITLEVRTVQPLAGSSGI